MMFRRNRAPWDCPPGQCAFGEWQPLPFHDKPGEIKLEYRECAECEIREFREPETESRTRD